MALMTRLTRLFRADMHAVLDRMEEPDVLLRQAIREMEDDVAEKTTRQKSRELERQQAETRAGELEASLSGIGAELDLCFEADNESLARTLLRRRLECERLVKHLRQRMAELDRAIAEQRGVLDEQRRRLESMRQKAELFDVAAPRSEGERPPFVEDFAVTDADVDIAYLREQQKRRRS